MNSKITLIHQHQTKLKRCKRCADMCGPVVVGLPVDSPILLVGQAPGVKEIEVHK